MGDDDLENINPQPRLSDKELLSDEEYFRRYKKHKDGTYNISYPSWNRAVLPNEQPNVGWWESWLASNTSSALGQAVRKTLLALRFWGEWDADPFQDEGIDFSGYEEHLKYLGNSSSNAEVEAKKKLIDDIRNEQYLASNGHGWFQAVTNGIANIDMILAGAVLPGLGIVGKLPYVSKLSGVGGALANRYLGGTTLGRVAMKTAKGAASGAVAGAGMEAVDMALETPFREIKGEQAVKGFAYSTMMGGIFGGFFGAASGLARTKMDKIAENFVKEVSSGEGAPVAEKSFNLGATKGAEPADFGGKMDPGIRLATSVNPEVRNLNLADNFLQYKTAEGKAGANPMSTEGTIQVLKRERCATIFDIYKDAFDEFGMIADEAGSKIAPHKVKQAFRRIGHDVIGMSSPIYTNLSSGFAIAMRAGDDASVLLERGFSDAEINIIKKYTPRLRAALNETVQDCLDKGLYNLSAKEAAGIDKKIEQLKADYEPYIKQQEALESVLGRKASKVPSGMPEPVLGEFNAIRNGVSAKVEEYKVKLQELEAQKAATKTKRYTVKDFDTLGDKSYLPRVYLKDTISAEREQFMDCVKRGLLDKNPNLSSEELKQRVSDVWDHIMGNTNGSHDYSGFPGARRAFEKGRTLDIDSKFIEDYLDNDVFKILINYTENATTDAVLMDRYGVFGAQMMMDKVEDMYEGALAAAKAQNDTALIKKLTKEKAKDAAAAGVIVNRLRGFSERNPYMIGEAQKGLREFGRNLAGTINNLTASAYLGMMPLSSISDLGQMTATIGFKNMWKSMKHYFNPRNKAFRNKLADETFIRALDRFTSTREMSLAEEITGSGIMGMANRFSRKMANISVYLSGIHAWDRCLKNVAGYAGMEGIINGSLPAAIRKRLGISPKMYERIREQFKKHGETGEAGEVFPHALKWDDIDAKLTFQTAVNKLQNQAVLTPGAGTQPMFFEHPFFAPFKLFKSFAFAAYSKCLIPVVQTRDLNALMGAQMMFSLSAFKTTLKASLKERDVDYDTVVKDAVASSDFASFLPDATGAIGSLFGESTRSNMAGKKIVDIFLGAPGTYLYNASEAATALYQHWIHGKQLTDRQRHIIRMTIPMQNNAMFVRLFNYIEKNSK